MAKLINQIEEIRNSNPFGQIIPYPNGSNIWNHLALINSIVHEVLNEHNTHVLTRQYIFNTKDTSIRIVKTLVWGFLIDNRGSHLDDTLENLSSIAEIMETIKGTNLTWKEYVRCYNHLRRINGVGRSTENLLFYFFNVRCEGMEPVAITGKVTDLYDQFEDFDRIRSYTTYPKQIDVFNNFAFANGVRVDQIEYYMYRVSNNETTIL